MAELPELLVTDTHPLVWFATGQQRKLSRRARAVFDAFERGDCTLLVPSPVLMELWFLSLNGTIAASPSLRAWWRAVASDELVELSLEHADILLAAELDWKHRDPHDRLIVATALRMGCPLLTADNAIADWGGVDVYW
jgi:PIN domain nuclease of toxin-antitoxin system